MVETTFARCPRSKRRVCHCPQSGARSRNDVHEILSRSPLWVTSEHFGDKERCPLYPKSGHWAPHSNYTQGISPKHCNSLARRPIASLSKRTQLLLLRLAY